MENNKPNAEQSYRTMLMLWSSLLMSQFLFVGMVYFVKPELFRFEFSKHPVGDYSMLIIVLAVIAFSNFGISFWIRKYLVEKAVTDQSVPGIQTALIVGCALCESVSLLGLLAAFAEDYQYFFVFSAVGILGTILHIPKRSDIFAASYRSNVG